MNNKISVSRPYYTSEEMEVISKEILNCLETGILVAALLLSLQTQAYINVRIREGPV